MSNKGMEKSILTLVNIAKLGLSGEQMVADLRADAKAAKGEEADSFKVSAKTWELNTNNKINTLSSDVFNNTALKDLEEIKRILDYTNKLLNAGIQQKKSGKEKQY